MFNHYYFCDPRNKEIRYEVQILKEYKDENDKDYSHKLNKIYRYFNGFKTECRLDVAGYINFADATWDTLEVLLCGFRILKSGSNQGSIERDDSRPFVKEMEELRFFQESRTVENVRKACMNIRRVFQIIKTEHNKGIFIETKRRHSDFIYWNIPSDCVLTEEDMTYTKDMTEDEDYTLKEENLIKEDLSTRRDSTDSSEDASIEQTNEEDDQEFIDASSSDNGTNLPTSIMKHIENQFQESLKLSAFTLDGKDININDYQLIVSYFLKDTSALTLQSAEKFSNELSTKSSKCIRQTYSGDKKTLLLYLYTTRLDLVYTELEDAWIKMYLNSVALEAQTSKEKRCESDEDRNRHPKEKQQYVASVLSWIIMYTNLRNIFETMLTKTILELDDIVSFYAKTRQAIPTNVENSEAFTLNEETIHKIFNSPYFLLLDNTSQQDLIFLTGNTPDQRLNINLSQAEQKSLQYKKTQKEENHFYDYATRDERINDKIRRAYITPLINQRVDIILSLSPLVKEALQWADLLSEKKITEALESLKYSKYIYNKHLFSHFDLKEGLYRPPENTDNSVGVTLMRSFYCTHQRTWEKIAKSFNINHNEESYILGYIHYLTKRFMDQDVNLQALLLEIQKEASLNFGAEHQFVNSAIILYRRYTRRYPDPIFFRVLVFCNKLNFKTTRRKLDYLLSIEIKDENHRCFKTWDELADLFHKSLCILDKIRKKKLDYPDEPLDLSLFLYAGQKDTYERVKKQD